MTAMLEIVPQTNKIFKRDHSRTNLLQFGLNLPGFLRVDKELLKFPKVSMLNYDGQLRLKRGPSIPLKFG